MHINYWGYVGDLVMIKCIAFDLWDTLIYLENGWRTFNILKQEFGISQGVWKRRVKPIFLCRNQPNEKKLLKDLQEELDLEFDLDRYAKMMFEQRNEDVRNVKVYSDVRRVIEGLKSLKLDIGVISNQATFYEPCFFDSGFSEFVDFFVFSNRVGYRKPDPRIYKEFLRLSKADPREVVAVGNNIDQDYRGPMTQGMKALLLNRSSEPINSQIEVISSLEELISRVK